MKNNPILGIETKSPVIKHNRRLKHSSVSVIPDICSNKQTVFGYNILANYVSPKISVSFKKNRTETETKISNLKNKTAEKFFKELYAHSPEKCSLIINNDAAYEYVNAHYGIFNDNCSDIFKTSVDMFKDAVNNTDTEDVEYIINSLSNRYEKINGKEIVNGIILFSNDKKAYKYVLDSPVYDDNVYYSSGYTKDLCKYLLSNCKTEALKPVNFNTVIEIEKGLNNDIGLTISRYKNDSDAFSADTDNVSILHNYLENCINENDITAYRGEKSSWIFDPVSIDKTTEMKTKLYVFLNPRTRNDLVFPNNKRYSDYAKQSVYDYISKKDKLTLADAMLVAKYTNDTFFIKGLLDKINNAVIEDSYFKSYTLSEHFAKVWARRKHTAGFGSKSNNMLSVVTKTNIKKGNRVHYCYDISQYEFIMNNTPKIMTFHNAKYDRETNTFYTDCELYPKP